MVLLTEEYPEHVDLIRFGDHCYWAWDCFHLAKAYCNAEDIQGWCGVDSTLVSIFREYSLLQIAKIHDPAESRGYPNHSLKWLAAHYGAEAEAVIGALQTANAHFIESVLAARKKVIAHSDLEALRLQHPIGAFEEGADENYFRSLHEVVTQLYELAGIGPFPEWPHFAQDDAEEFLEIARNVGRSRRRQA